MSVLIQDLAVSVIALGAAGMIVRRAVALFAAKTSAPACSNCASGCTPRTTTSPTSADQERRIIRPVVIHATTPAAAHIGGGGRRTFGDSSDQHR